MCLFIIWSDVTVREGTRRLHTSECAKFKIQKIKYLFITIKVQLITISSVIPYISETNSTSSSLKKNPQERERKREREKEKGEGKRGRETEKEGEGEERKGKEGRECAKGKENEMGKKRKRMKRE